MFKGLLYEPQIARMILIKTVLPMCILFPILYGVLTSMWPLVQLLCSSYSVPVSLEAIKDVALSSLHFSVPQIPDYGLDCLFYAFVRNKFTDKYLIEKGKLII